MSIYDRRLLYIVIRRDLLSLRYLVGDQEVARYEDAPQIACDTEKREIVADGKAATEWAQMPGHARYRAFNHPRVAVEDRELTGKVLLRFYQHLKRALPLGCKVAGANFLHAVVVHWREPDFVPLAPSERDLLLDLAVSATGGAFFGGLNAAEQWVCELPQELTPSQVQSLTSPEGFPASAHRRRY